ncbi:hypothetical protein ACFOOP_17950 [Marinicaulis aureus]|uniref:Uncharacterized protein n=1 Tax=Hyphococcus aureus TaxID=2666033 RepID=A0ABW1KYQ0_9PROT
MDSDKEQLRQEIADLLPLIERGDLAVSKAREEHDYTKSDQLLLTYILRLNVVMDMVTKQLSLLTQEIHDNRTMIKELQKEVDELLDDCE